MTDARMTTHRPRATVTEQQAADALPSVYRAGNDAITAAYRLGIEEGRSLGYEEQARDHHNWLLNADEQIAQVADDARRFALLDAAEAWDTSGSDAIKDLAAKHYRAGGPSMPTIWLRLRATGSPDAPAAECLPGDAEGGL